MKRRSFLSLLGGLGAGAVRHSPLAMFVESILGGFFYEARAQGNDPRYFLSLSEWGAPPRWCRDLFLDPYGDGGLIPNKMVGNRYVDVNGTYTDIEYATVERKGIHANWIWQFDVPKADGGERPLDELLDYGLFMQGMNTLSGGHLMAQIYHYKPAGIDQTLGALSADYGSAPIAAIDVGVWMYPFASRTGKSPLSVSVFATNLQGLMKPFLSSASEDLREARSAVDGLFDRALDSIDRLRDQNDSLAGTVARERKGAEELLRDGFSDLEKEWNELLSKYRDLISRSIRAEVPGLNDKPIGVPNSARGITYRIDGNNLNVSLSDLRDMIVPESNFYYLAETMALAEFALRKGITKSFVAPVYSLYQLKRDANSFFNLTNDQHFTGSMVGTLVNSMVARAYGACLLELIDQMKKAGIWEDLVIDCAGEFGRNPRNDGSGSDHGWTCQNIALYSGAMKGPLVLGNTLRETGHPFYSGSWGSAAPVELLGGPLGNHHFVSTVAHLLRVPSPVTSASTVVALRSDGKLIPIIEKAKLT